MDAEQFRHIYYPYRDKLFRIANRLLENIHTSEDAVQETYLKLWDKRKALSGVDCPEAFAVIILRNICINHIRQNRGKVAVSYDYNVATDDSLDRNIESKDEMNHLEQMINDLPEQQKRAMMLRHYDECTYEEIGEIMDLNDRHVRVIVSRARKTLREQFVLLEKTWIYED